MRMLLSLYDISFIITVAWKSHRGVRFNEIIKFQMTEI